MLSVLAFAALLQTAQPTDTRSIVDGAAQAAENGTLRAWLERWRRNPAGDRSALLARGLAASHLYQHRQADSLLTLAARSTPSDAIARQALVGLARVSVTRGNNRHANDLLVGAQQAAFVANDTDTAIDALLLRAGIARRVRSAASADPLLDSAEAAGALLRPRQASVLHCRRAGNASIRGDLPSMRRFAQLGVNAARSAGSKRLASACHFVRATSFARAGVTDSLRVAMDTTIALQRASGDLAGLAAAQQWQGFYLTQLGQHARGSRMLGEAWTAARASGSVDAQAWTALSRASLASTLNNAGETQRWLAIADTMMSRSDDAEGQRAVLRMRATAAFGAGDYERGWRLLDALEAASREAGDVSGRSTALATRIRQALNAGNASQTRAALASWRELGRGAQLSGLEPSALLFESELAILEERWDDAGTALAEALRVFHSSQHHVRLSIQLMHALVLVSAGDSDGAARMALDAEQSHNRWRATLTDSALRRFANTSDRGAASYGARLIVQLARRGRMADAMRLSESQRARQLREQLAEAGAWAGSSTTTREQEIPALSELQRALPDAQTAAVVFVTTRGRDSSAALILTRSAAWPVLIGPLDGIAPRVQRLLATISAGRAVSGAAREVGGMLLDPLVPSLDSAGIERLVIVPDDLLHLVPFEALLLTGNRHVVERFGVSYMPSLAIAHSLWTQRTPATGSIVAFGDPQLPTRTLGALPGARREVAALARRVPGAVARVGQTASEAEVKRNGAGEVRLLHVAAHGVVDAWDGRQAALMLAPGGGEDGVLYAGEIAALRLDGATVVLSACETNNGELVAGEGATGLTSAFLRAGARSVVTTSWRIRDGEIGWVVDQLYAGLASGRSLGDALREAQRASLRRGDAPLTWAAFRIVGNASSPIALR